MASDGELSVSKKYIMDEESEEKDETCPFNLLPEKVVEIIFNKLGNVDLQKCLNTCDTWKNILKPKRIYFQFELVLPVLLKRLSLEDCLSCRLVCRKWKKGVDTVLDNHPSRVNVPDEHTRENAFPLRFINAVDDPNISTGRLFGDFGMVISRFWTFFSYRDKIDRNFMEEMNSHCGNPFVGRNLKMRVNFPQEYVISARTVLERFGTHIWYARLRFDDSMRTQAEMEEFPVEIRIRDALSLLPNLKSLCLDVCIHERTEEASSSLEIRARNYFQRHPLPTLRNLETFSCGLFFRTPSILIDSVLELCCVKETLKILDLSESKAKYKSTFKFPNLEDLVIKVDMEELPGLVEDYPHLKKLRLFLSKRNGGENESPQRIHCEEVFVVLESLQDNLIELGIQAEQSKNWSLADSFILCSCRDDFRINFPNLESLGLHCHVRPENLQNLGSLKHLELRVFIEEADADSFNLNMGLLIPSLKSLHYYGSRANIKLKRDVASGMLLVQNEGRYVDVESKEGSEDQGAKEWEEEGEEEGKEVRFHIWSRMFKRHLIYSLFMFSLIFGLGVGCGTQFLRH